MQNTGTKHVFVMYLMLLNSLHIVVSNVWPDEIKIDEIRNTEFEFAIVVNMVLDSCYWNIVCCVCATTHNVIEQTTQNENQ